MPINRINKDGSSELTKFKCNECDFTAKSKGAVTHHFNITHRDPHARKKPRKANQNQGRPTILTPVVIGKLVAAFNNGLTKVQAFRYAGISKDVYYDAIKNDSDFADKMQAAQEHLNFKAREVVAQSIEQGDTGNARWWLERKSKDEFSPRREVTGSRGGAIKTQNLPPKVEISDEELNEAIFGKQ